MAHAQRPRLGFSKHTIEAHVEGLKSVGDWLPSRPYEASREAKQG